KEALSIVEDEIENNQNESLFMSQFIDIGSTQLHHDITGGGKTLIFIHAGISDMRMWDEQVTEFAKSYRVLRYDVRGWGKSKSPDGKFYHHEDLLALMTHHDIYKAVLIGASHGGKVAIDFALTYPEKVTGLVLVGAAVGGHVSPDDVKAQWNAIEEAYESGDLERATDLELDMWVVGPERQRSDIDVTVLKKARQIIHDLFKIPEEDDMGNDLPLEPVALNRLSEIHVPALVIQGDKDVAYHIPLSEKIAADIPNARYVVMENTAHLPNMEQPDTFNKLLRGFLAG
ncbi:MAG: alpha/beta fold hydrolase, partial [Aggregatilineales bacterium]